MYNLKQYVIGELSKNLYKIMGNHSLIKYSIYPKTNTFYVIIIDIIDKQLLVINGYPYSDNLYVENMSSLELKNIYEIQLNIIDQNKNKIVINENIKINDNYIYSLINILDDVELYAKEIYNKLK